MTRQQQQRRREEEKAGRRSPALDEKRKEGQEMTYRFETLREYTRRMRAAIKKAAERLAGLHVHFSQGNTKIGRVLNVSTASGVCCGNCSQCLKYCYDIKAALRFPEVFTARAENTAIAIGDRERFFAEISEKMDRRRRNLYFRWHQGGEILDADYFERMVQNAAEHPAYECIWTYTKMHHIVNDYVRTHGGSIAAAIPANMVVMFSEWDGIPLVNPYGFPVFSVRLAAGNKNHGPEYFRQLWKCPGNCDICKKAGRGCIAGESTFADEH